MKLLAAFAATLVLAACSSGTTTVSQALHPSSPSPSSATSLSPSPMPSASATQVPLSQGDTLISVRMTSLDVMWAATTDRILRSTNAGRSWVNVTPPNPPGQWSGFFALDDGAAWATHADFGAATFTLFRTTDAGRSWTRSTGSQPGGVAGDVTFVDRLNGWLLVGLGAAAGSEAVAVERTTDGGATWRQIARTDDPTSGQGSSGLAFACDKGELAFGSASVGLLPTDCAGGAPTIYRTADGGQHWSSLNVPGLGSAAGGYGFTTPIFLTATEVVMAGRFYANATVDGVAVSHNGGSAWTVYRLPGTGTLDFATSLSGWLLSDSLWATSDGGRSWNTIGTKLPFKGTDMTLQFLGLGIAIAFARYQTTAWRTDDGGRTWRSVAPAGLST